jgi:hypothetical protein
MKRLLAGLAMITLAATGCGGGSPKVVADKASASPAATATEATSIPTDVPTSATDIPTSLAGVSADCLKVAQEFSKSTNSLTAGNGDVSAEFGALAKKLKELKGAVSDDKVKSALDTLSSAYQKFSDNLKGVDYKPGSGGAPPAAYLAAIQGFTSKDVAAAAQTLGTYFSSSCKK